MSPALQKIEDSQDDIIASQSPQDLVGKDDDNMHHIIACDHDSVADDDNAFWTQAADMVERKEWEEDEKSGERDSAFLDEVLSGSLLLTPLLSGSQSYDSQLTPHTNSLSPNSADHCTPHTYHSAASVKTPLTHRHGAQHKPHPLF